MSKIGFIAFIFLLMNLSSYCQTELADSGKIHSYFFLEFDSSRIYLDTAVDEKISSILVKNNISARQFFHKGGCSDCLDSAIYSIDGSYELISERELNGYTSPAVMVDKRIERLPNGQGYRLRAVCCANGQVTKIFVLSKPTKNVEKYILQYSHDEL